MATFLHTMVRITDPERSWAFHEALGLRFSSDMDIVRDEQLGDVKRPHEHDQPGKARRCSGAANPHRPSAKGILRHRQRCATQSWSPERHRAGRDRPAYSLVPPPASPMPGSVLRKINGCVEEDQRKLTFSAEDVD